VSDDIHRGAEFARQQAVIEAAQRVESTWVDYATGENVDLHNVGMAMAELSNALTAALAALSEEDPDE